MYVTVRNYAGGHAFADALVASQDDVRGVIGTIAGFQAYYVLRDDDGVTTISVFADQAGADASTSAAAAYVAENMADVAPAPPVITKGEVLLSF